MQMGFREYHLLRCMVCAAITWLLADKMEVTCEAMMTIFDWPCIWPWLASAVGLSLNFYLEVAGLIYVCQASYFNVSTMHLCRPRP